MGNVFDVLLRESERCPYVVIDTSFLEAPVHSDEIGNVKEEITLIRRNLMWRGEILEMIVNMEERRQKIVIIDEVIQELREYLNKKNKRNSDRRELYRHENSFDEQRFRLISEDANSLWTMIRQLRKRGIGFNEEDKKRYDDIFSVVESAYWDVAVKEKPDLLDLEYKQNSFGSDLETDRKVIATSFALCNKSKTLTITRDCALERVITRAKNLFRHQTRGPYVHLSDISVFNAFEFA